MWEGVHSDGLLGMLFTHILENLQPPWSPPQIRRHPVTIGNELVCPTRVNILYTTSDFVGCCCQPDVKSNDLRRSVAGLHGQRPGRKVQAEPQELLNARIEMALLIQHHCA